jgi:hypothetical protein
MRHDLHGQSKGRDDPVAARVELPDGAEVRLTIPDVAGQASFAERYAGYIGVLDDLPPDLAAKDHESGCHPAACFGRRLSSVRAPYL